MVRRRLTLPSTTPGPTRQRRSVPAPADAATDAARWRALLNSEHIRVFVDKTKDAHNANVDPSRMKVYFEVQAVNPIMPGTSSNYFGREILTDYADRLRKQRRSE